MVENRHWENFFKAIRPAFKLPSRHELSHKLLDEEYQSVYEEIQSKIKMSSNLAIQCDGWTNIR